MTTQPRRHRICVTRFLRSWPGRDRGDASVSAANSTPRESYSRNRCRSPEPRPPSGEHFATSSWCSVYSTASARPLSLPESHRDVATEWKIASDGLTLHLQDPSGIRFHDGRR